MPVESKPVALLKLARPLFALAALGVASGAFAEEEKEAGKVADASAAQNVAATATAAEPTPPPTVATTEPEQDQWFKRIKVEGLIDTFYSHNFAGADRIPSSLRVFDASNSAFTVAYAELAVSMPASPVGFRLDLGFGPVADFTSFDALDPRAPGVSEVLKHLQQAYGSVAIGKTGWVVDAGKFVTTAGAEVIEARFNWNYSRSILFGYAIPFTHTGIRVGGPITDTISLQASLVNGWEVINDNNRFKTLGLSGTFAPPTGTTVTLTLYGGPEGETATPWRNIADLVVLQKMGDRLALGLNGDYGNEGENASWYGAALMAEYKFTPWFRLAGRAERFYDPDGVRGIGTDVSEGTLTAGFAVGSNAEIRAEVRGDTSPERLFRDGTQFRQATGAVALLAWF
jgi:hypothetical protein